MNTNTSTVTAVSSVVEVTTLQISPMPFSSLGKILQVGNLTAGFSLLADKERKYNEFIFAQVSSRKKENIVLFYKEGSRMPGGVEKQREFLAREGYKMVDKPHPSLLINIMNVLSEERLRGLGITDFIDILLPTPRPFLVDNVGLCCLGVRRSDGERVLDFFNIDAAQNFSAYLVQKM
jgi:hypothetical protein